MQLQNPTHSFHSQSPSTTGPFLGGHDAPSSAAGPGRRRNCRRTDNTWLACIALVIIQTSNRAIAQTYLDQARQDITNLTSVELRGRGYYGDGHLHAADYLRDQFHSIGLDSTTGGYLQTFRITEKQLQEPTELLINGRKLKLGTDYLPRLSTNWAEAQEQLISSLRIRVNDS